MRLLWEESLLGAIGAMIVAAFSLGTALIVLEGMVGLGGGVSVILSALTAVGVLEAIDRRYYAEGEPPAVDTSRPSRGRSEPAAPRRGEPVTAAPGEPAVADAAAERAA